MFSPGRRVQGRRGYLGVRFLFSQFCPRQAFHPGDHLHLAVNCSGTVFSSLTQFPSSIAKEFS